MQLQVWEIVASLVGTGGATGILTHLANRKWVLTKAAKMLTDTALGSAKDVVVMLRDDVMSLRNQMEEVRGELQACNEDRRQLNLSVNALTTQIVSLETLMHSKDQPPRA